ncbi:hypothetical protein QTG56_24000 (plasmid) [Rossellomorea sp. AcN35-11]|nr:hypothetical protein [Rossellomorea aquimaris]WJV31702.1 hypothetical protein QTG56_24000 [Rossellomorea sp. AcN35-11]
MIYLFYVLEEIFTFFNMIFKFPLRAICKANKDHDWRYYGGGFIFSARYSFVCKRCGCRSKGDIEDMKKKGFKGNAKLTD